MQMYLISTRGELTQEVSRDLQRHVRKFGGFILMVTRTGPIVALDDAVAPVVEQHPLIGFMGAVTLNPHGAAADRLQRIFAENLSQQLIIAPADTAD